MEDLVDSYLDITWRCMACHDDRPDSAITVTRIEVHRAFLDLPYVFNLRHCIDRVSCVALAQRTKLGEYLIDEEP